jgi:catechol 2,3-dioxygenase-like lactoylglutathione lyase family enzyme
MLGKNSVQRRQILEPPQSIDAADRRRDNRAARFARTIESGKALMLISRPPPGRYWQVLVCCLSFLIHTPDTCTRFATADEQSRPAKTSRIRYVEASEQLIVELYVRDVKQSAAFFEQLGFDVVRKEPTFAELGWDDSRLYLEQLPGQPDPPATVVANVRIMVSDVDRYWKLCQAMKLPVKRAIGDRYYGLRDFTVVAPDGIGLRFASKLKK